MYRGANLYEVYFNNEKTKRSKQKIPNVLEKDTLYEEMLLGRGLNMGNPTKKGKQKTKNKIRK